MQVSDSPSESPFYVTSSIEVGSERDSFDGCLLRTVATESRNVINFGASPATNLVSSHINNSGQSYSQSRARYGQTVLLDWHGT